MRRTARGFDQRGVDIAQPSVLLISQFEDALRRVRAVLGEPAGEVDAVGLEVLAEQELAAAAEGARHAELGVVGCDPVAEGEVVVRVGAGAEGDDGSDCFVAWD